ncbi:MAG: photosynthetic reaction center subunit H [Pseudomonadota bacterium]
MVEIVGNIDVAQMVLYAFWLFFAGLIWYLQAESRREGYPLEEDLTGKYNKDAWLSLPTPKTFKLPNGQGERTYPNAANRDTRPVAARRASPIAGAPLIPTGNPLTDCIGPSSWAERPDHPDLTPHGTAKIVPMSTLPHFSITEGDLDPRGLNVVAADGNVAGTISDAWIDQSESLIRYFEIDLGAEKRLIPLHFAKRRNGRAPGTKEYFVTALMSDQFTDVPQTAAADKITMLEEEKIMAYYGGGNLYATPKRSEPLL